MTSITPMVVIHQFYSFYGNWKRNFALIEECYRESKATLNVFADDVLCGCSSAYENAPDFFIVQKHYLQKIEELTKDRAESIILGVRSPAESTLLLIAGGKSSIIASTELGKIRDIHHMLEDGNGSHICIIYGPPSTIAKVPIGEVSCVIVVHNLYYDSSFNEALGAQSMVEAAVQNEVPVMYVNQLGICGSDFYPGCSMVISASGDIEKCWPLIASTSQPLGGDLSTVNDYSVAFMALRHYCAANNFPGIVIGISGGIDSALSLVMSVDALGADNVRAIMMPSTNNAPEGLIDSIAFCQKLGVRYDVINIDGLCDAFSDSLSDHIGSVDGIVRDNIQPRTRAVLLMAFSNKLNYLLLNCGNKTEFMLGYCTIYGDSCGGFSVLSDIYKTDVYRLAHWRNENIPGLAASAVYGPIPEAFIKKTPSAELHPMQTDEADLPFGDYSKIDQVLKCYFEKGSSDRLEETANLIRQWGYSDTEELELLLGKFRSSAFKRQQSCTGVRITSGASEKSAP